MPILLKQSFCLNLFVNIKISTLILKIVFSTSVRASKLCYLRGYCTRDKTQLTLDNVKQTNTFSAGGRPVLHLGNFVKIYIREYGVIKGDKFISGSVIKYHFRVGNNYLCF